MFESPHVMSDSLSCDSALLLLVHNVVANPVHAILSGGNEGKTVSVAKFED